MTAAAMQFQGTRGRELPVLLQQDVDVVVAHGGAGVGCEVLESQQLAACC